MPAPATIPASFTLRGDPATITAAPKAGEKNRFSMVLYSGKPFNGWGYNAVLDMAGGEIPSDQVMPMLRSHRGELIVGQSDKIALSAEKGILVEGDVYPETAAGAEVLALSAKGFRWQASFGVHPIRGAEGGCYEWVERDETKTVNGHAFSDGLIIRKWRLKEGSFLPIGADPNTSALAASADGAAQINLPERRSKTPMAAATIEELESEFPDRPTFVLAQAKASATLEQARGAFAQVLQTELVAARAELAEAKKAPAAAPAPAPRAARTAVAVGSPSASMAAAPSHTASIEAGIPAGAGPATVRYLEATAAFKKLGKGDAEARAEVSKRYPELQREYIAEANGGVAWDQFPMPTAKGFVRR